MSLSSELFLSAYTDYLQETIDNSLTNSGETRIVTQSLMPNQVLSIFEKITDLYPASVCASYLRVAHGLIQHWQTLKLDSNNQEAFIRLRNNSWLDEEDKLTWYRNRTIVDEEVEKLLVLLVGIDHTTDKGGLADFFVCTSSKVWHSLGGNYHQWLERITEDGGITLGEKHYGELNEYLMLVSNLVPLTLSQKSDLLEVWLENYASNDEYSEDYDGLLSSLFASLTKLGIPYLRINDDIKLFRSKKGHQYLKTAHQFISHRLYNQGNRKIKDLNKIRTYLSDSSEVRIYDVSGNTINSDVYLSYIENFILNADNECKSKLIEIDLLPILKALNIKEEKEETTSNGSIPSFDCHSFEAVCKGLNFALEKFSNDHQPRSISLITVKIKHFQHDFNNKDAQNSNTNKDEIAKTILKGVLGGIENYIRKLDFAIENCVLEFVPLNDETTYRSSASNPHVVFETKIIGESTEVYPFKWKLSEFQIERLHVQLAKTILQKIETTTDCLLPVMLMNKQIYQAIYHASNQEEACRLMSLGLSDMKVVDLFKSYDFAQAKETYLALKRLSSIYSDLLKCVVDEGLYVARNKSQTLLDAYNLALEQIMTSEAYIAQDIKEKFYYGFFMTEDIGHSSFNAIESVLVNGYHPAAFELISAQIDFITFAISDTYRNSGYVFTKNGINDVFIQSKIETPVLALKQKQGISTHAKSFGWLHYIGEPLDDNIDLSVQALLQETDDDEDTQEVHAITPEESVIYNILSDYQRVYFHAKDGLRILAINVTNLSSLLSGLTKHCQDSLIKDINRTHYSLHISVYTIGLSKLTAVSILKSWQEDLVDKFSKKDKVLQLRISHFNSDATQVNNNLKSILETQDETKLGRFDIAFNFSFLQTRTYGKTDPAPAINLQSNGSSSLTFPIIYYPKPIIQQQDDLRELRLSQRQIDIQSKHANLTANLEVSNRSESEQYFVVSRMEYQQDDIDFIETLHQISQWVVNIDEYFDFNLLKKGSSENNKVISFSSGYGHYGELNVTLSTAHNSQQKLKESIYSHISGVMHYLSKEKLSELVDEILRLNESLSGVANIKAVLGNNEAVRNLYGYALSIKAIPEPEDCLLSQWIPLDSCQHWFKLQDSSNRADLLQLSLKVDQHNKPILSAHVVEAKIGSPDLVKKAEEQIETSIHHLSKLFAPRDSKNNNNSYNRRYWWGQLHRALVLRSHINQAQAEKLNIALERLSEGDFIIHWTSSVVICQTEDNSNDFPLLERFYTDEFNNLEAESKKYFIRRYSEDSFERAILDDVNWKQASDSKIEKTIKEGESNNNLTAIVEIPNIDLGSADALNLDSMPIKESTEIQSVIEHTVSDTEVDISQQEENVSALSDSQLDTNNTKTVVISDRKIMIGTEGRRETPVYWEYNHEKLSNRHLLIFGSSGSGKTYAIQCLLSELALAGVSSFIVDYTDGFLKHQSEPIYQEVCKPQEYFIIKDPLPINPFKSYSTEIFPGETIVEQPFQVAIRVKNILNSVYTDFGSQQVAIIDKVLEAGLTANPNYNLEGFVEDLQNESTRGESVANKIRTLVKMNCFDNNSATNLYEDEVRKKHAVQIIQLTQIPKDLQRIITEFVLWDLWAYVQKNGHKSKPITIVLDEMQNLDHSADSPIDKLLREGRKYGISLILATQTVSNFNTEEKDRLFQASTKLFFKPATTEISSFADLLSKVHNQLTKSDWIEKLNSLEKGQCFFVGYIDDGRGQFKEVVSKLDITALENRDFDSYVKDKQPDSFFLCI